MSRKIKLLFLSAFLAYLVSGQALRAFAMTGDAPVSIEPEQLLSLTAGKTVVIDTRSGWKYFLGHIPGALNLPDWRDFTEKRNGVQGLLIEDREFIAARLRALGIDRQKTIVLYGDPSDRWRTDGRFLWMFERFGFDSVRILEGGLGSWKQSGGDIERGKQGRVAPSGLSAKDIHLNDKVTAKAVWIHENRERLAIIDNRTEKEYQGATPYGSARGGHIPNAVHIPWERFFTETGVLKNKKDLNALLAQKDIRSDQEIVVYCTGGVRSGMAYYAFRSLGYAVRNYDGSWWDWSLNSSLPVEGLS